MWTDAWVQKFFSSKFLITINLKNKFQNLQKMLHFPESTWRCFHATFWHLQTFPFHLLRPSPGQTRKGSVKSRFWFIRKKFTASETFKSADMIKCWSNKSKTFRRAKYTLGKSFSSYPPTPHCKKLPPTRNGNHFDSFSSRKLLAETLAIKRRLKWVHSEGLRSICCSANLSFPPTPHRFTFANKFWSFKMVKVSIFLLSAEWEIFSNIFSLPVKFPSTDGGTSGATSTVRLSLGRGERRSVGEKLIKVLSFRCLRAFVV